MRWILIVIGTSNGSLSTKVSENSLYDRLLQRTKYLSIFSSFKKRGR